MLTGTTARPPTGKTEVFSVKVFSGKYLPVVNIHNNEVLRGTTARPPGNLNYDKPRLRGWENYRKAFGTSPIGAGKTEVFSGKVFSGTYLHVVNIHNNEMLRGTTQRKIFYFFLKLKEIIGPNLPKVKRNIYFVNILTAKVVKILITYLHDTLLNVAKNYDKPQI
jgi:hypothetical protein